MEWHAEGTYGCRCVCFRNHRCRIPTCDSSEMVVRHGREICRTCADLMPVESLDLIKHDLVRILFSRVLGTGGFAARSRKP